MFEQYKKELLKNLKDVLQQDPSWASNVLVEVTMALKEYEKSVKEKRDSEAYHAIGDLFMFVNYPNGRERKNFKLSKTQTIAMMDSIMYKFPRGLTENSCANDLNAMTLFCGNYFDGEYELHNTEWESGIRNASEYMTKLKLQWEEYKKNKGE